MAVRSDVTAARETADSIIAVTRANVFVGAEPPADEDEDRHGPNQSG
jgi:hypothetical protein